MNEREAILSAIRSALPAPDDRTVRPSPVRAAAQGDDRVSPTELFLRRFVEARGRPVRDWAELREALRGEGAMRGYIDPALAEEAAGEFDGWELTTVFERERIDDYAFGITRAAGAVAETGSLILTSGGTPHRLAALAPWIHVAVLRPRDIHATVVDAVAAMGDDPAVVWVTGPSKTADIEGILVEGVHGPGVQMCLVDSGCGSDSLRKGVCGRGRATTDGPKEDSDGG